MFYWLGGIGLTLAVILFYQRHTQSIKVGYSLAKIALGLSKEIALSSKREIDHVAGNVYAIPYTFKDREYKYYISIPKNLSSGKSYDTYAYLGEVSVDISQQPGVSYSITPSDFGDPSLEVVMVDEVMGKEWVFQGNERIIYP